MKLVIYREDGEVLEVINNCGEVTYDEATQTLRYRGGELWPFTNLYAVLNDDEEVTVETLLVYHKQKKAEEIDRLCEQAIYRGFEHDGYWFSFDLLAQLNFVQQGLVFHSFPDETETKWKTENAGVITLSRDAFFEVARSAERHKRSLIGKYWQLKEQIQQASTFAEVNAIRWDQDDG